MAVRPADFMLMKNHDNMNSVLKAIGLDEGQQRFIEVWKRFDMPTQNLKYPDLDAHTKLDGIPPELGVVAKLARDFVSGLAGGTT